MTGCIYKNTSRSNQRSDLDYTFKKEINQVSNTNMHLPYPKTILHHKFDDFLGNTSKSVYLSLVGSHHLSLQFIEYLKLTYWTTEESPMLHGCRISANAAVIHSSTQATENKWASSNARDS